MAQEFQESEQSTASPQLDQLPPELLVRIMESCSLKDVVRMQRVSKRFQTAALMALPKVAGQRQAIDGNQFRHYVELAALLKKIGEYQKVFELDSVTPVQGVVVAEHCRNLESLSIKLQLPGWLSHLNWFHNERVDDNEWMVAKFFSDCAKLTELHLTDFRDIKGTCFETVPVGLEELSLRNLFDLREPAIVAVSNRCPKLRKIRLEDALNVRPVVLRAMVTQCPMLEEFIWVRFATDDVFWVDVAVVVNLLVPNNPLYQLNNRLVVLKLQATGSISNDSVHHISQACPSLREIEFAYEVNHHFTAAGLSALANLQELTSLSLRGCNNDDHGGGHLIDGLVPVLQGAKLVTLDVSNSNCSSEFLLTQLVNYVPLRKLDCSTRKSPCNIFTNFAVDGFNAEIVEQIFAERLQMAEQEQMHPLTIIATGTNGAVLTEGIRDVLKKLDDKQCHCEFLPGPDRNQIDGTEEFSVVKAAIAAAVGAGLASLMMNFTT